MVQRHDVIVQFTGIVVRCSLPMVSVSFVTVKEVWYIAAGSESCVARVTLLDFVPFLLELFHVFPSDSETFETSMCIAGK